MGNVKIRVDNETYERLKQIKFNLESDIKNYNGKCKNISVGNVIKFAVCPKYNENYIQVDLNKIAREARVIKRR